MAKREIEIPDNVHTLPGLPAYNSVQYSSLGNVTPPNIKFSDIHSFMIEKNGGDVREEASGVRSYRTLDRAVSHFQAGDVQNIGFCEVDTGVMYGSATVLASMKKVRYQVYIHFVNHKPEHAYCQCPIGLAQCCSHVGGFLFAINSYNMEVMREETATSCTSKKSAWNVPRKMTSEPKPLKDMSFSRPKSLTSQSRDEDDTRVTVLNFDPRHSSQRIPDAGHYLQKMMELKTVFPNTGMSHLAIIPDPAPPYESEQVVCTSDNPLEEKIADMIYEPNTSTAHLLEGIDQDLSAYIEEQTRGQRESTLWKDLHKGRITSSLFGDVLHAGPNPASLIQRIFTGSNLDKYSSLPKAVQWGVQHEKDALEDYLLLQNSVTTITVAETGLTIYPSHPFLGASSDGKITDMSQPSENRTGVLEIKCPYSIKGRSICDMEVHDIVAMGLQEFCLEMTEQGTRLRRNHKYYAQVQGEMAIMGCSWCDFVVWTAAEENNCFVERILFDPEFVSMMLPKLVEFLLLIFCIDLLWKHNGHKFHVQLYIHVKDSNAPLLLYKNIYIYGTSDLL